MPGKILWVEDDYWHVKGLLRPLEKEGFAIEAATSALEAYEILQGEETYDVIIVDLILPCAVGSPEELPPTVAKWDLEEYTGLGLLKWMLFDLEVTVPLIVLSVAATEDLANTLLELGVRKVLPKRGLFPPQLQAVVHAVLEDT